MPSLFSRKSGAPVTDAPAESEPEVARSRAYTPSKKDQGKSTPKRSQGGRVVEPPPANRKEATKRAREKARLARAEQRAGAMAGKDEFLPKRDQGPERGAVRDVVDSRRNLASYFLPTALIVIIGTSGTMPLEVRLGANLLTYVMIVGVAIDSFVLSRKIKAVLTKRFPDSKTPPRRHYGYGIMRSLSFRRMRIPAARVKLGEKI